MKLNKNPNNDPIMLRFIVTFSSRHMALMFLWYDGIGDILYYIWSALRATSIYTLTQVKKLQSSLSIRRELSNACDTRAFFSISLFR